MKSYGSDFLAEAGNLAHRPLWLAAIAGWNGQTVRWADWPEDVSYGGQSYLRRHFTPGALSLEAGGSSQGAPSLTIDNADLAVSALCAAASPVGCAVTLYRVFAEELDADAQGLALALVVDGYRLSDLEAELSLVPRSTMRDRIPARSLSRTCPWVFKGAECGYSGGQSTCDKTETTCRVTMANFANFGGFRMVLPKSY